ncbi:hypothetical protein JQC67_09270 [Aurantibacter crassamenti]|uniref:hypothetical protein n=1 Tax=Aurantibacter crassamenti TaxID=1837375 RepID=UPI00193A7229|nr:hypothetical protein [Aurantibacter crassamenti]MBM1106324.1 hypothetical protein [Aurantibacter crassamenti]
MMTFFSILLVLIAVNAVLMIFSLNSVDSTERKPEKEIMNNVISKAYRVNFTSSKYKEII